MWIHYLFGKKLTLVTNHISLKYVLIQYYLDSRQGRLMECLIKFEFDIKNIKGKENKIDDVFSRNVNPLMKIPNTNPKTYFAKQMKVLVKKYEVYLNVKQKLHQTVISHYANKS